MVQTRSKPRWPRILIIILLALLVVYALLGFVALPWWLEKQVPERLSQHLGWQGSVDDVAVNPFALSVEVTGLRARDGGPEPVVSVDRLYLDVGFWSLFRGVGNVQEATLDQPRVRLDLLPGYEMKIARDWFENNPSTEAPAPEPEANAEPPRIYLDKLTVNGGDIRLRDLTGEEPRTFPIAPLDLNLNDLATWQREDGASNYYLLAAVNSQTIEWQGSLSLLPLESDGFLKLSDVQADTLTHFLADQIPLDLREGRVTVSSDYQFRSDGESPRLETSGGEVTLRDLSVASGTDQSEPEFTTRHLALKEIAFSLQRRSLSTGKLSVEGLALSLLRNPDGTLPLVSALQRQTNTGEPAQQEQAGGQDSTPWRWSVEAVELSDSRLRWQDRVPATAADLMLEDVRLELGRLSDDMDEPVRYQMSAGLGSEGRLSATGQVTPDPFNLEAALSGSDLALARFQPYLQQSANLMLADGRLTFDGHLDLDGQDDPMTGTFGGQGEISHLDLRLDEGAEPMVTWQALRLENIEYNLTPARLEIGTVTLAQPSVSVIRNPRGVHNLQLIARGGSAGGAETEVSEEPAARSGQAATEEAGDPAFIFRIRQLLLEQGRLAYTDRSMEPAFATELVNLKGSVSGLSNVKPQQGQVNISGTLAGGAPLRIEGSLGSLGSDEQTEIHLTLENYATPALSPYFGRYLGYGVDSGKLRLDLDYRIQGTQIDASNQVVMDQLALGQAVDSPEAVNVPVKLGLALLRDRQGVIDIRLPISGDLSDPSFSVSQIVGQAFINLLGKAATSPFSMLGSLVDLAGFSAEELGQVGFVPGRADISDAADEKLAALAEALSQRPALMLSIRGGVTPDIDEPALRRLRLYSRAGIEPSMTPGERLPMLERNYEERVAEPPLDNLRQQVDPADEQAWENALLERLSPTVQLPPEALGQLASARAEAVRTRLEEAYSASPEQLFLKEPDRQAPVSESGDVLVQFNLEAR